MSYFGTAGDRTVAAMRDIVYDDCPVLLTSPATGGVVSDNFSCPWSSSMGQILQDHFAYPKFIIAIGGPLGLQGGRPRSYIHML